MSGTIALHGGGEFLAGDEPFLTAWLQAASRPGVAGRARRVAIVTTAAARGRPELAGAHGVDATGRVAACLGLDVEAEVVPILDASSAADPDLAARLTAADAIHLPGGDPDLIPAILGGSRAWSAIQAALADGAALAGASAGAMALAAWTWTPAGLVQGLGLVPGPPFLVMPHADAGSWSRSLARFGQGVPPGVGVLGIGERTGVLIDLDGGGPWPVVGEAEVRWLAAGAPDRSTPQVLRAGDALANG